MNNDKIVLCRPTGGITDSLVQIEQCFAYAGAHDRVLWVDSMRSGLLDCFSNYFQPTTAFNVGVPTGLSEDTTYFPLPPSNSGLNYAVEATYDRNVFFAENGKTIKFDFNHDYDEDVLIYEQFGGGAPPLAILSELVFLPYIADRVKNLYDELGKYESIHVRHSDYLTDYPALFSSIRGTTAQTLVLCTDSFEVQRYAKDFFGSQVIIPNTAPQTGGQTLHKNPTLDRRTTNASAFEDLMLLANGTKIYSTTVKHKRYHCNDGHVSGFTKMAMALRDEPDIRKTLLG